MTDISERLAKLTPEQRALLDARLRDLAPARPPDLARIPRRARTDRNRLTVDQERIWLIHQFDPADPVYNVFFGARLTGELDVAALERAVNSVVQRHEALRSTFELDGLRPVQVTHDSMEIPLRLVDLRGIPADEREAEVDRLVTEEVRRPMDLATGPLLRVELLRVGDREHVLVGTVDHLVWDRASAGMFEQEWVEYYTAFVTGREPRLPELEIHYGDYAEWQPEWLREEVHRRQLPYWKERLKGAPLVLEMPADLPRPPVQTFNGARYRFTMSTGLTEAIREFARREGVTVNVALLAAWQLLLHRYTGQEDIVVGTTSSTRSRPETEPMIGYFLTMLPLRTTVRPGMTFRELVRAARATMVGAFDHHDMPFGTLLDELDIERDPSRNPVYQVSYIFVDFHEKAVELPGLVLEPLLFDNGTCKDELMVCVFDERSVADHFFGMFEYNTDLFTEDTVARIWRHLEHLLEQVVAAPDRAVREYALIRPDEAATMLTGWNRTAVAYEPARLEDLVQRQTAATPEAVAVECGGQSLTYAELFWRARHLAGRLRGRGAGPGTVAGICLERSCDLVVALLGTMMTGAAYLPLDPGSPPRRLAAMASDAAARIVVTTSGFSEHLAECPGERVFLDRADDTAGNALGAAAASADDLAYVIYTSGSTGRPKGVEISHRGLVNLLRAMAGEIGLGPGDVLTAVTSISFDIAGLELFAPLITGARVVVATREQAQDGRGLARLLAGTGTTVMQATPATWQLLVEAGWTPDGSMRIITGGEALPPALARDLVRRPGHVWNVYGPTETTIWSTARLIEDGDERISIGRPLANTEAYVLDDHLQPVPPGVPGELYLGGDGVARGYRGRPGLTAERFVPDHLGPRPGARLYRTGDTVGYRSDGSLIFLGRGDGQVKLRGYRIELGEIETRLEQHPDVRRAAVLVREDRPGDRRLVGYLVAGPGEPRPADLREHLRTFLPDYMVPAAFVTLPAFPLTTSGKIDRRALPPPPAERASAEHVPPRDPVELKVARVWEDVLGTRPIGIHDGFFDLGGHSLLVLRLMAEIERRFGTALPMAAIFQGATVERFARMLRQGYRAETGPHLVELRPGTGGPPVFFAHPAGSEVVCYTPFAGLLEPADRPLYALGSPPVRDGRLPFGTFEERAAAYARIVRQAQPEGPYTLVGWCYGGANAFAVARALEDEGQRASVVLLDAYAPEEVPEGEDPGRAPIVEGLALNLRWDYTDDQKSLEELYRMTDDMHLDYLLDLARQGDYLPPDAGREQVREFLDLWSANLKLLWRYRPTPMAGPVTLIQAGAAEHAELFEPWRTLAGGGLDVRTVEGNHYTIMREPRVGDVAAILNDVLAGDRTGVADA